MSRFAETEVRREFGDMRELDPDAKVVLTPSIFKGWFSEGFLLELMENAERYKELSFKILTSAPEDPKLFEGRGTYHLLEDVVYVKGIGSHQQMSLQNDPDALFRAFGEGLSNPFFDKVVGNVNAHPRTLGAETLRWAILEFLTAGGVLSSISEYLNVVTLEDVRRLGLTIPVVVTHFPLLTRRVGEAILTYKKGVKNWFAESLLEWEGNFEGLGTVALCVPSSRRFLGKGTRDAATPLKELPIVCLKGDDFARIGETLRALIAAGFVFSYSSAHVQNMYDAPESICPQADNSDLIPLGALTDVAQSDEMWWLDAPFSKAECQTYAISSAILRYLGYAHLDLASAARAYYGDDGLEEERLNELRELVEESRLKLKSLLASLLNSELKVLDDIVCLVPWFAPEIALAVASRIMDEQGETDRQRWNVVADRLVTSIAEVDHILDVGCLKEFEDRLQGQVYMAVNGVLEYKSRAESIYTALVCDDSTPLRSLPLAPHALALAKSDASPVAVGQVISSLGEVIARRNELRMVRAEEEREIWFELREALVSTILSLLRTDEELAVRVAESLPPLLELQNLFGKRCWSMDIRLDSVLHDFLRTPTREFFLPVEALALAIQLAKRTGSLSRLLKEAFSTEEKKPSIFELLHCKGMPGVFFLLHGLFREGKAATLDLISQYANHPGGNDAIKRADSLIEEIGLPLLSALHHHTMAELLEDEDEDAAKERLELRDLFIAQTLH